MGITVRRSHPWRKPPGPPGMTRSFPPGVRPQDFFKDVVRRFPPGMRLNTSASDEGLAENYLKQKVFSFFGGEGEG